MYQTHHHHHQTQMLSNTLSKLLRSRSHKQQRAEANCAWHHDKEAQSAFQAEIANETGEDLSWIASVYRDMMLCLSDFVPSNDLLYYELEDYKMAFKQALIQAIPAKKQKCSDHNKRPQEPSTRQTPPQSRRHHCARARPY